MIDNLITLTESAKVTLLDTSKNRWQNGQRVTTPSCVSVVGVLGETDEISIEIPIVSDPDVTEDTHWQQLVLDGSAVTLSATNHAISIPVGLVVRINKPATAGNAIGIRWM